MDLNKKINNVLSLFNIKISKVPSKTQLMEAERIRRIKRESLAEAERKKILWLQEMNIKTVIDIGANIGQFAKKARNIFPDAMIYSFEPLPDCYSELELHFKNDKKFKAFNLALGNIEGETVMDRNDYSPSSSILPMAELHKEAFIYTQNTKPEVIRIAKLDNVIKNIIIEHPLLVKIDVQGYEDKVIAGGENTLSQASLIICEVTMHKLYENQPLFDDIYTALTKKGFQYGGNYEQLHNPNDGRIVQADGIFFKTIVN